MIFFFKLWLESRIFSDLKIFFILSLMAFIFLKLIIHIPKSLWLIPAQVCRICGVRGIFFLPPCHLHHEAWYYCITLLVASELLRHPYVCHCSVNEGQNLIISCFIYYFCFPVKGKIPKGKIFLFYATRSSYCSIWQEYMSTGIFWIKLHWKCSKILWYWKV